MLDNPRPTLNHAIWSVYLPNIVETYIYTDNVTDSVFFILWNIPVLLVLTLYLKGIINTLKRYYVAMECADVAAFAYAT